MGTFHFKKFSVVNERSAMKVNTDGVLLGASMTISPADRMFLDVGTGTGTIALMAAQRAEALGNEFQIQAIDIDEVSVEEARANFSNSPWGNRLAAVESSLDDFSSALEETASFDLIFSNPPYFEDSLNAPEERRNNARHTSTGLSYREILDFASRRLSAEGRVCVVLPSETEHPLCRHARMSGLHLFRIVRVRTVPRKAPSRIIAEFSRVRTDSPEDTTLTIQDEGKYTQEYLSLTRDFYLFA